MDIKEVDTYIIVTLQGALFQFYIYTAFPTDTTWISQRLQQLLLSFVQAFKLHCQPFFPPFLLLHI